MMAGNYICKRVGTEFGISTGFGIERSREGQEGEGEEWKERGKKERGSWRALGEGVGERGSVGEEFGEGKRMMEGGGR